MRDYRKLYALLSTADTQGERRFYDRDIGLQTEVNSDNRRQVFLDCARAG